MKHIILFISFISILGLVGCAGPRSATMCISGKTGTYVKCPKGYEPGDVIEKSTNNQ